MLSTILNLLVEKKRVLFFPVELKPRGRKFHVSHASQNLLVYILMLFGMRNCFPVTSDFIITRQARQFHMNIRKKERKVS